jgi:hypothetical protein
MTKGNMPRIGTLKRWAFLNFSVWLAHQNSQAEIKISFSERSRWSQESVFRFFKFKEDHGGSQGLS